MAAPPNRRGLQGCGLSPRETERRLARIGLLPADISGILVTHEHDIALYAERVIHVRDGRIASDEHVTKRWDAAEVLRNLPELTTDLEDDEE